MNIFNLVSELEKVDGDVHERLAYHSRRSMFSRLGKMAAGAVPVAMASVFNKAYAFTPGAIDVLNFALTLEYLEDEFYKMGNMQAMTLIPSTDRPIFAQIGKHETSHVNFLKSALGAAAVAKPMFDFTGGSGSGTGPFADVFTNYATFLAVSHAFEDTGVRAYKGQAGNLMADEDEPLLEYALQIHSVEARHAAVVRYILNANAMPTLTLKPWITLKQSISPLVDPVYAGEQEQTQGGIANLVVLSGKSVEAVTEAFDEPLSKQAVLDIAKLFIKP